MAPLTNSSRNDEKLQIEFYRTDDNPDCDHALDPDTVEVLSIREDGVEIEGECKHCDCMLYDVAETELMGAHAATGKEVRG